MKAIISILLIGLCSHGWSQVLLRSGESWIYTFPNLYSSFPVVEVLPFSGSYGWQRLSFAVDPASFQTGSQLRYEIVSGGLYEGNMLGCFRLGPMASGILTSVPPSSVSLSHSGFVHEGTWLDLWAPGGVRLTALSGSVLITNVTLEMRFPNPAPSGTSYDRRHFLTFSPTSAPPVSVARLGPSQTRVTWPSNVTTNIYVLEVATNFPVSDACQWVRVTNTPTVLGDRYALDFDSSAGAKVFRLRRR